VKLTATSKVIEQHLYYLDEAEVELPLNRGFI